MTAAPEIILVPPGRRDYGDGGRLLPPAMDFLSGGGEMGALIRAKDWSKTPLGPIEEWPLSLRTMVSFMLANRFPLLLWWGPDYISIYNDPYRSILGAKHPWALGTPVRECWSEIWDVLKPLIDAPFHGGPATWSEDLSLEINRYGFVEETHFTVAYSPVPDETAPSGIGGVLATVHEVTEKIIGERRITALRDLAARSGEAKTAEEACSIAMAALGQHPKDVPFAMAYLFDDAQTHARLACATGVEPGDPAAPTTLSIDAMADTDAWPVSELLRHERAVTVENLAQRLSRIPSGPWSDPPHMAILVPIRSNVTHRLTGFLVAGVSPRLRLDGQYRSFFDLAASQTATTIAAAQAYEEERRRAEALAEIDRVKTLFFSNVSHEFRTPLALMLGPLEDALASADLPADDRQRLEVAHRNSLRLLKLVNSLLDFSRIEAGRMRAFYEPADLAALTAELASNFRSACEQAGVQLIVDCPSLPQPIHVDRDMWEKIVLNLLSNAFKFTFEGQIAVSLRLVDGSAELSVCDTGVGIPEDELPRLFERFHRIEGQKSRTYEGSGIGLALTQELVKLHQGDIRAESKPGHGTTFTVSIPCGTAHLPADRLGAERNRPSTSIRAAAYVQEALRWLPDGASSIDSVSKIEMADGVQQLHERAHVLVADDNADMRAYLCRLLMPCCDVETVADGDAALQAIRRRRPDLVIADVMMPRLDGFGLMRAVRQDSALRDLSLIMLSARAGEESRVDGLQAGADDYLVKPFSGRELIARVSANLKLARVRRQATEALRESAQDKARLFQTAQMEIERRQHVEETLRDREQRLAAIFAQATVGFAETDVYGRFVMMNDRYCEIAGRSREELLNLCAQNIIHLEDLPNHMPLFERAANDGEPFDAEQRYVRPDSSWIWVNNSVFVLKGSSGRVERIMMVCVDIMERKRQEEHQKLLLNELNHRVKNTLATVQSIAVQTLRSTRDAVQAREQIGARLVALSNAHDVLTREHWEGAPLDQIVGEAVAPHRGAGRMRFEIEGPRVWLSPKRALALAMALHELCTNAAKYGALSNDTGRVRIEWTVDGFNGARSLRLQWIELDGPPAKPPSHQGFGSRLIERGLQQDLGGEVRIDFAPSGVICMITAPLSVERFEGYREALPRNSELLIEGIEGNR